MQARKMLSSLEKENNDTLKFYLKQGMQLKNREMLKETMEKVQAQQSAAASAAATASSPSSGAGAGAGATPAAAAADTDIGLDKELITAAAEMLKSLVSLFVRASV